MEEQILLRPGATALDHADVWNFQAQSPENWRFMKLGCQMHLFLGGWFSVFEMEGGEFTILNRHYKA